jgi:hypothetical protein
VRHAKAVAAVSCGSPTFVPASEADAQLSPTVAPLAPGARAIAARFAPILRYDSAEKLLPIDRARYVEHTKLWAHFDCRHGPDTSALVDATPTLDALPQQPLGCPPTRRVRECHFFLKLAGVKDMQLRHYIPPQHAILAASRPTVYWHLDMRAHTIQYWFFYIFNAFLNQHQGDWEQATLALDPSMTHVTRVGLSSHHGGRSRAWTQLQPGSGRDGDHVIVYVARGSHANYFSTGRYRVPEARNLKVDRSNGAGRLLTPRTYRLLPLQPPVFAGDYGPGNYTAAGHKKLDRGINVSDPQQRDLWLDPLRWLSHTNRLSATAA